jgi:hypothetical protein
MNRPLPPRDRGRRSRPSGWSSRRPRALPGVSRLVRGTAATRTRIADRKGIAHVAPQLAHMRATPDHWPSSSTSPQGGPKRKKPAAVGAGRAQMQVWVYFWILYVRSPPSGLKDSTVYPAFFIAPAMNPRTVCFCQPIVLMISEIVAPCSRWSIATT